MGKGKYCVVINSSGDFHQYAWCEFEGTHEECIDFVSQQDPKDPYWCRPDDWEEEFESLAEYRGFLIHEEEHGNYTEFTGGFNNFECFDANSHKEHPEDYEQCPHCSGGHPTSQCRLVSSWQARNIFHWEEEYTLQLFIVPASSYNNNSTSDAYIQPTRKEK